MGSLNRPGALVVRDWMTHHYRPETVPFKRHLMLAPANFGSQLAHKGRAWYGRVFKGWKTGGQTFFDTISVSGALRFDMITPNLNMSSGFSTVDIVVNSKGNPRVVYAMDNSPDGRNGGGTEQRHGVKFPCPHKSKVPGIVPKSRFLLIGRVMFFIHNDQP